MLGLQCQRWLAGAAVSAESEAERGIASKILAALPQASKVAVADTSGGCGSMYSIEVVAPDFRWGGG